MRRYTVAAVYEPRTIGHTRYGIWDSEMDWFCALPDPAGNMVPLEWRTPYGAEDWLLRCLEAWYTGQAPAPEGWRA